jgi:hypothetical protein
MYWIPAVLLGLTIILVEIFKGKNFVRAVIFIAISIAITGATVGIDFAIQTADTEVWSGQVTGWDHDEEYEEWHPPVTSCTTDSKGKQSCTTTPGYYEHHYAENHIYTTDDGWVYVDHAPNGREFDDNWPNTAGPLKKYWPAGTGTASTHSYVNKVQASYSIYKHKQVDLKKYPDLPKYPDKVHDYFLIDRIVGKVPNKQESLMTLNNANAYLNHTITDKKTGKKKSYKEVNLIFVNVGANKPEEYGFALQDKWENGNKNDFIVSFSMNNDGTINWVYPFSWSESERLKIDVREYMLDLKKVKDFKPVVNDVSKMVEDGFVRKQFADFNYLQIDTSTTATVIIWVLNVIVLGVYFYILLAYKPYQGKPRYRRC